MGDGARSLGNLGTTVVIEGLGSKRLEALGCRFEASDLRSRRRPSVFAVGRVMGPRGFRAAEQTANLVGHVSYVIA